MKKKFQKNLKNNKKILIMKKMYLLMNLLKNLKKNLKRNQKILITKKNYLKNLKKKYQKI